MILSLFVMVYVDNIYFFFRGRGMSNIKYSFVNTEVAFNHSFLIVLYIFF